ncbi:hypothetical protein VTP01DRAFT_6222 [Rhizomucor pusillus]|uniref:uncharacterized protein n=1 Tax=Rhizomucor pusillus TaxID=4840 RepID=UPI0037432C13
MWLLGIWGSPKKAQLHFSACSSSIQSVSAMRSRSNKDTAVKRIKLSAEDSTTATEKSASSNLMDCDKISGFHKVFGWTLAGKNGR